MDPGYKPETLYNQPVTEGEYVTYQKLKNFSHLCFMDKLYFNSRFIQCPNFDSWLAISMDHTYLITKSTNPSLVMLWKKGKSNFQAILHDSLNCPIVDAEFNKKNTQLATLDADGGVWLWSLQPLQCLKIVTVDSLVKPHRCAFSPENDQLWLYSYHFSTINKKAIELIPTKIKNEINQMSWSQQLITLYCAKDLIELHNTELHLNKGIIELYHSLPKKIRSVLEGNYSTQNSSVLRYLVDVFY